MISTLRNLSISGFHSADITAALQTVEIRTRQALAETRNVGVELLKSVSGAWVHGRDVFGELGMNDAFSSLRRRIANREPVFQDLLTRYLVNNPHRVDVVLRPDPELASAEHEAQLKYIHKHVEGKSKAELQQIADETKELARLGDMEDSPQDIEKIPILTVSDIDSDVEEIPQTVVELPSDLMHPPTLLLHPQPTADVMYATLALNVTSDVSEEDVSILPLLAIAMNHLGTAKLAPKDLDQEVGLKTGGIQLGFTVDSPQHGSTLDDPYIFLEISSSALGDNVPAMFQLMFDMLRSPGLDQPDAEDIMMREVTMAVLSSRQTVQSKPFSIANSRARAQLKPDAWIWEQLWVRSPSHIVCAIDAAVLPYSTTDSLVMRLQGATHIEAAEEWQRTIMQKGGWDRMKARLKALLKSILGEPQVVLSLVSDNDMLEEYKSTALDLLEQVQTAAASVERPVQRGPWTSTMRRQHEALVTRSGHNMLVYGAVMPPSYKFHGSADAVTALLDSHLLAEVRTEGGAFDSWITVGNDGYVAFKSYVDPNLEETVSIFDESPAYLYQFADDLKSGDSEIREAHERELTEAMIVAARDNYPHLSPVQKGQLAMKRFLRGTSYKVLQQWKSELLKTSASDIRKFADGLEGTKPTLVAAISNATSAMLVNGLVGKLQFDSIVTDLFL